ncbi:DUF2851 family protein [Reichenbachiella versicolor]|uniref:DUF2851 family protein n=1 Tax=Reichenbachiella versicolor TaxID=1821036 RepID=UPI000D6DF221|nr:DUF2851 family protein [Reichenbachiella versicolor]
MRESFLHFIWQFQKYDPLNLSTSEGKSVEVYSLGQYNRNSGPDFLNAKLLVDDITWYGHVEIHLRSSDWKRHRHHHDEAYNNVIMHIVWEHDLDVSRQNGEKIPVIELKNRVKSDLLDKCNQLIKSPEPIPCQDQLENIRQLEIISMMEQTGIFRLEKKSTLILDELEKNRGSWEETAYQLLAKNFGFKTNSEPFHKLSKILPHKILVKHRSSQRDIEALLFGIAGFLPKESDNEYISELIHEYQFLSKKYNLVDYGMLKVEWKFMRMRPANFPTIRLSQIASFFIHNSKFFDQFINFNTIDEVKEMFESKPSIYWQTHYDIDRFSSKSNHGIGSSSINNLIINTVAPLLAAYSQKTGLSVYMDKSIELLESIKPEKNNIIDSWNSLGLKAQNAFESQSLISLKNDFCLKKKCLSCKIGVSLINR